MIPLAKVTKPWGLSGAVSVFVFGDSPDFFCRYSHFFIEDTKVRVSSAKIVSRRVVLFLSCSQSIDDAENLRGALLCLPRDEVISCHRKFSQEQNEKCDQSLVVGANDRGVSEEKDETTEVLLINDFIGLDIFYCTEQKKQLFLGKIDAFYEAGTEGVFEILSEKGSFFVPAHLFYFENIDLNNKKAHLVHSSELLFPEGLLSEGLTI